MCKYSQVYTIDPTGSITVGGQAKVVEGNFDTFAAVGNVRVEKNSLGDSNPEELVFKSLFVFDFDWAKKWDKILYNGKTDGLKTGIFLPAGDSYDSALVIDDELQCCELVEVGKGVTKEVNGLTRHYNFDGFSLSIVTTAV